MTELISRSSAKLGLEVKGGGRNSAAIAITFEAAGSKTGSRAGVYLINNRTRRRKGAIARAAATGAKAAKRMARFAKTRTRS